MANAKNVALAEIFVRKIYTFTYFKNSAQGYPKTFTAGPFSQNVLKKLYVQEMCLLETIMRKSYIFVYNICHGRVWKVYNYSFLQNVASWIVNTRNFLPEITALGKLLLSLLWTYPQGRQMSCTVLRHRKNYECKTSSCWKGCHKN